ADRGHAPRDGIDIEPSAHALFAAVASRVQPAWRLAHAGRGRPDSEAADAPGQLARDALLHPRSETGARRTLHSGDHCGDADNAPGNARAAPISNRGMRRTDGRRAVSRRRRLPKVWHAARLVRPGLVDLGDPRTRDGRQVHLAIGQPDLFQLEM